jgi:hypothetical protein
LLFEYSIARPPNARERETLARRHDRLQSMANSITEATQHLQELVAERPLDAVRIRHGFVRCAIPTAEVTSDRKAPGAEHRPSATRLMSPNGIALEFELIALLEAQSRTKPGRRPSGNSLPLKGSPSEAGWTDFIATGATASGDGRHRMSIIAKKFRQLVQTLNRLHAESLVDLPNANRGRDKHENFLLMREDVRRGATNDLYYVPEQDYYFTVPTTLFTNGWIYVLEDSELALLLITARMRSQHGDEGQRLGATTRLLNYGLARDSFEAHRVLDYLGLIDVIADPSRSPDGKVDGFKSRSALPHELLFHPEVLEKPGLPTILETIEHQLEV